jgi:hypothetical protein
MLCSLLEVSSARYTPCSVVCRPLGANASERRGARLISADQLSNRLCSLTARSTFARNGGPLAPSSPYNICSCPLALVLLLGTKGQPHALADSHLVPASVPCGQASVCEGADHTAWPTCGKRARIKRSNSASRSFPPALFLSLSSCFISSLVNHHVHLFDLQRGVPPHRLHHSGTLSSLPRTQCVRSQRPQPAS